MRKLLTVSLLGVLMSIPLVVFAQASLYGSIRTGIESNSSNKTGVIDFISRWGFQGSSEVSEGLTAVYRYERKIRSYDAEDTGGRLSYVGLSGSFGTVTIGKAWSATHNHFGGIVDQTLYYGRPLRTGYRLNNAVSYSVSVGNVSLQADAVMDQGTDKTTDEFNFGATLGGLMETGSIAIAHRKYQDVISGDRSSTFIAGNYGIGDMTVFLGYDQYSVDNSACTAESVSASRGGTCSATGKRKTTHAGVHGGVGDTGVNYVFTMRSEKITFEGFDDHDNNTNTEGVPTSTSSKLTPWTLGVSRSLGGGATLNLEHNEPDRDVGSFIAVWLQVDF